MLRERVSLAFSRNSIIHKLHIWKTEFVIKDNRKILRDETGYGCAHQEMLQEAFDRIEAICL